MAENTNDPKAGEKEIKGPTAEQEQAEAQKTVNDQKIVELEELVQSLKAEVDTMKKQLVDDPKSEVKSALLPTSISVEDMKKIWSTHLPETIPFKVEEFQYHFPRHFDAKPYTLDYKKGDKQAKINYL